MTWITATRGNFFLIFFWGGLIITRDDIGQK